MRILGFVLLLTLGVSNVTLKRRLPPKRVTGGLFNLGAFKNMAYTIYCLSGFVTFLGLYTGSELSLNEILLFAHSEFSSFQFSRTLKSALYQLEWIPTLRSTSSRLQAQARFLGVSFLALSLTVRASSSEFYFIQQYD